MKTPELEKLDLPPTGVERLDLGRSYDPVRETWVPTGKSIEDSREKSMGEYQSDIIEKVCSLRIEKGWIGLDVKLCELVDAYNAALRKANREGR